MRLKLYKLNLPVIVKQVMAGEVIHHRFVVLGYTVLNFANTKTLEP